MTQGGSLGLDEMGNDPRNGWDQGEMQMSLQKGSGETSGVSLEMEGVARTGFKKRQPQLIILKFYSQLGGKFFLPSWGVSMQPDHPIPSWGW